MRLCVKYMQNFPKRIKTDMALPSIGITDITTHIDKHKLQFLRRLCTAPNHSRVKQLFLHRLMSYQSAARNNTPCFIADIFSIIGKYDLSAFISNFIETGYFPPKMIWKRLVQRNFNNVFKSHFKSRTHANPAMNRFISIHPDCLKPLRLWTAT